MREVNVEAFMLFRFTVQLVAADIIFWIVVV